MYQDVISWWINETPYTIFVTNSRGTKFNDYIEKNAYTYTFLYKNPKKYKIYTLPCLKNLAKWDKFPGTGPLKEIYKITCNNVLNAYKNVKSLNAELY